MSSFRDMHLGTFSAPAKNLCHTRGAVLEMDGVEGFGVRLALGCADLRLCNEEPREQELPCGSLGFWGTAPNPCTPQLPIPKS